MAFIFTACKIRNNNIFLANMFLASKILNKSNTYGTMPVKFTACKIRNNNIFLPIPSMQSSQ